MVWPQTYNPLGHLWLSTAVAALPIVALLSAIALLRVRIHWAALGALAVAVVIALGAFRMPAATAGAAMVYGAGYGLFPIGWLILNVIFLYDLTVAKGHLQVLREGLARVAPDPRIQLILIAFAFGAFLEGVAGFGAPVAITAAILIQLGFRPLHASALALIANTAPVAFGSLGIPITTLEQITGIDARQLSAVVGRQLFPFSLIIPFWIVAAYSGWRGARGVWREALVAGLSFSITQFLLSNYNGPWLASILAGAASMASTVIYLRLRARGRKRPQARPEPSPAVPTASQFKAWVPWIILSLFIVLWGLPPVKAALDHALSFKLPMPHLHLRVLRVPPVAPPNAPPEPALFALNVLSATGTAILLAALISGFVMGFSPARMAATYARTLWRIRYSLLTIAAMLALGNLTKYSGGDATLGLALAHTGRLYPFFGTMLGWIGVALTGSDTASNVLFGSLQKITAHQLGINPALMCGANSSGGVMGKMIDAQSIVVASTATNSYGNESQILRFVFFHSVALAVLMSTLVFLQAHFGG
ncbi:MAG TPA: L-lactate permease [Opitutaceae bacterium]|nr:L-lactate permease [Opitutaceae bacterium]